MEFFHSLTDGTGGSVFLKTLLAEYLLQKYQTPISAGSGVLPRLEVPAPAELRDDFPKYAGPVPASRQEKDAWHYQGTKEADGRLNLICFRLDTQQVRSAAHTYGTTITGFLCAVLMQGILNLQSETVPNTRRRKAIKVQVPINLRRLFPSSTLRNFSLYCTPELDPRLGSYDFREICKIVRLEMDRVITPKQLASMIATNVRSEQSLAVRLMPLPLKNLVMKAVFLAVGEKKSFMSLSNLGAVELPDQMKPYITRMDFILVSQSTNPHNCSVLSLGDTLYWNFTRNIREPDLERHVFRVLQELGISVIAESNQEE